MRKIFILVIMLIACIVIFLIVKKENAIVPPRETLPDVAQFTLVAFGDSLTAGLGVTLDESYPSILQRQIKERNISPTSVRVINMGVSGETTTGGLDRVEFVMRQNPDIVLLGLGANDMLRATDPSVTRRNLSSIIEKLQANNIPVVLLGMRAQASNGADFQEEFDSIYPELAETYSLPLVPFFLAGVALVPEFNTPDGIHPNKAGYEKIVTENIMPVLAPYLPAK